jgi:hypothetical protein
LGRTGPHGRLPLWARLILEWKPSRDIQFGMDFNVPMLGRAEGIHYALRVRPIMRNMWFRPRQTGEMSDVWSFCLLAMYVCRGESVSCVFRSQMSGMQEEPVIKSLQCLREACM